MGEQPNVSLVAHVREVGEIEDGGDLNDKRSVEEDQAKTSNMEPVLIAEGLRPLSRKLVQKIQNWEFIDLEELLPNPRSHLDIVLLQQQDGVPMAKL